MIALEFDPEIFDKYRPAENDILNALSKEISPLSGSIKSLLDVGCGTGSYSIPLTSKFYLTLTGIDLSGAMLKEACRKLPDGNWINDNFLDWNSTGNFDLILMVYVLHLFPNWAMALKKAVDILAPDGALLVVTEDHSALKRSLVHRYMPKVLEVDLERFPKVGHILRELDLLGLSTKVRNIVTEQELKTSNDVEKLLDAVRARYISTLQFLEDGELSNGVLKMRLELMSQLKKGAIRGNRERSLIVGRH